MTGLVYIYTLSDSSNPEKIRYVGRTNDPQSRLSSHIYKSTKTNLHSSNWIAKVINNGDSIKLNVIHKCIPQVWETAERFFIKYYLDRGYPLTNIELGGTMNKKRRESRKFNDSRCKRIAALKESKMVACYSSPSEASKTLGISKSIIASCARKVRPSAYGYQWEYTQQDINPLKIPIQRFNKGGKRKVSQFKGTEFISTYISINEASRCTNTHSSNILEVCKNRRQKTAGGYIWKYT